MTHRALPSSRGGSQQLGSSRFPEGDAWRRGVRVARRRAPLHRQPGPPPARSPAVRASAAGGACARLALGPGAHVPAVLRRLPGCAGSRPQALPAAPSPPVLASVHPAPAAGIRPPPAQVPTGRPAATSSRPAAWPWPRPGLLPGPHHGGGAVLPPSSSGLGRGSVLGPGQPLLPSTPAGPGPVSSARRRLAAGLRRPPPALPPPGPAPVPALLRCRAAGSRGRGQRSLTCRPPRPRPRAARRTSAANPVPSTATRPDPRYGHQEPGEPRRRGPPGAASHGSVVRAAHPSQLTACRPCPALPAPGAHSIRIDQPASPAGPPDGRAGFRSSAGRRPGPPLLGRHYPDPAAVLNVSVAPSSGRPAPRTGLLARHPRPPAQTRHRDPLREDRRHLPGRAPHRRHLPLVRPVIQTKLPSGRGPRLRWLRSSSVQGLGGP